MADPIGSDKVLHVLACAALVALCSAALRWPLGRVVTLVVLAGAGLELVQGSGSSLGWALPAPIGGDAELADVVADCVGAAIGAVATTTWSRGLDRHRLRHPRGGQIGQT